MDVDKNIAFYKMLFKTIAVKLHDDVRELTKDYAKAFSLKPKEFNMLARQSLKIVEDISETSSLKELVSKIEIPDDKVKAFILGILVSGSIFHTIGFIAIIKTLMPELFIDKTASDTEKIEEVKQMLDEIISNTQVI